MLLKTCPGHERSHRMTKEDMSAIWILLHYQLIDRPGIGNDALPSTRLREPALLIILKRITMSSMVLGIYCYPEPIEILGKPLIAKTMFCHAMIDMQRSNLLFRFPDTKKNTMAIVRYKISFFHFSLLNSLYEKLNTETGILDTQLQQKHTHCMHLIISDIHGSEEGIRLVMSAIDHFRPDGILSAGDQCPDPMFSSFFSSLIAVRGNCDRFYEYDGIAFPPLSRELNLYDHRIIMAHGHISGSSDFSLTPGDVFITGHTHVPHLQEEDGVVFCNPGSPSRPRSSAGPTAALLSAEGLSLFSLLDFSILKAIRFSRS